MQVLCDLLSWHYFQSPFFRGLATKYFQDQNENISKKDPGACHKSDAHHLEKYGGLLSEDSQGDRFISHLKNCTVLGGICDDFSTESRALHSLYTVYIYTLNVKPGSCELEVAAKDAKVRDTRIFFR